MAHKKLSVTLKCLSALCLCAFSRFRQVHHIVYPYRKCTSCHKMMSQSQIHPRATLGKHKMYIVNPISFDTNWKDLWLQEKMWTDSYILKVLPELNEPFNATSILFASTLTSVKVFRGSFFYLNFVSRTWYWKGNSALCLDSFPRFRQTNHIVDSVQKVHFLSQNPVSITNTSTSNAQKTQNVLDPHFVRHKSVQCVHRSLEGPSFDCSKRVEKALALYTLGVTTGCMRNPTQLQY